MVAHLKPIVLTLLLLLSLQTSLAADWQQYAKDSVHSSSQDDITSFINITTADFTAANGANAQALIFDLDNNSGNNEIIFISDNQLRIHDDTLTELSSILIPDITDQQVNIVATSLCVSGNELVFYDNPNNGSESHLFGVCFDENTHALTIDRNITIYADGVGGGRGAGGVSCFEDDECYFRSVGGLDSVVKCTLSTGTCLTFPNTFLNQTDDMFIVPAVDDIDEDGQEEIVFAIKNNATNDIHTRGVTYIQDTGVETFSELSGSDSTPLFNFNTEIGNFSSNPIIIERGGNDYIGYVDFFGNGVQTAPRLRVIDITQTEKWTTFDCLGAGFEACYMSNPLIIEQDVCIYFYINLTSGFDVGELTCKSVEGVVSDSWLNVISISPLFVAPGYNPVAVAMDDDGDGNPEVLIGFGVYKITSTASEALVHDYRTQLGQSFSIPTIGNINNSAPNRADIITTIGGSTDTTNLFISKLTESEIGFTTNLSTICDGACLFFEPFSYTAPIVENLWFVSPSSQLSLTPTANQLQVTESFSTQFRHAYSTSNFPVVTAAFDIENTDWTTSQVRIRLLNSVQAKEAVEFWLGSIQGNDILYVEGSGADEFRLFDTFEVCDECLSSGLNSIELEIFLGETDVATIAENTTIDIEKFTTILRVNGNQTAINLRNVWNISRVNVIEFLVTGGSTVTLDEILVIEGDNTASPFSAPNISRFLSLGEFDENALQCTGIFCHQGSGIANVATFDCTTHSECCTLSRDGEFRATNQWCVVRTGIMAAAGGLLSFTLGNFLIMIVIIGFLVFFLPIYFKARQ